MDIKIKVPGKYGSAWELGDKDFKPWVDETFATESVCGLEYEFSYMSDERDSILMAEKKLGDEVLSTGAVAPDPDDEHLGILTFDNVRFLLVQD